MTRRGKLIYNAYNPPSQENNRIIEKELSYVSAASDGILLPTYIVYKTENLYISWCENRPRGTAENQPNTPKPSSLQPKKLSELKNPCIDSFVVVKAVYNMVTKKESVKRFIGTVLSIQNDDLEVKYLTRSTKAMNVYVFPETDAIMIVNLFQIFEDMKLLLVLCRGPYIFLYKREG